MKRTTTFTIHRADCGTQLLVNIDSRANLSKPRYDNTNAASPPAESDCTNCDQIHNFHRMTVQRSNVAYWPNITPLEDTPLPTTHREEHNDHQLLREAP